MSRLYRLVAAFFASRLMAVAFMAAAVFFAIFVRYGGGQELPVLDVEFSPFHRPPELVAQVQVPLRRIVVGPDRSVYAIIQPKFQSEDLKLAKVLGDGLLEPFPNADW